MKNTALSLVMVLGFVPLLVVGSQACAGKKFTPAQTAKVGTTLIESVRKVQQFTTDNVRTGAIPRNIGDKITDINTEIKKNGESVLVALDAWNAAADPAERNKLALEVFRLVAVLESRIAEATGVGLPTFELARTFSNLTSQVLADIEKIKAALRS